MDTETAAYYRAFYDRARQEAAKLYDREAVAKRWMGTLKFFSEQLASDQRSK